MSHETSLIATIAISLVFAFIGGMIAVRLRLPPLIGYLLAGIAVGPFTPGFVADVRLAPQLAEIGVILLMFGVGMHFSVRELWAVRSIALPGALVQILTATSLGLAIALSWEWPIGAGLVFGLALSVASTVVLLRALAARNALTSINGQIAVGWLIVEDLAMVLILVLLPALSGIMGGKGVSLPAGSGHSFWLILSITLAKVIAFIALMLVVGTRFFPWLLARMEKTGSHELFTLGVITLALGVGFGAAELFGVSYALGAFFAGVVVKQSDLSHRAASDLQPLQNAFSVLFFVSVGMMFNPELLIRQPLRVLLVVVIIVVCKSLAALLIVLLLRQQLSTALTVSAALAQIGEFSFILATLGVNLGVLPVEGRNLILAGALLSITLNPLAFELSARIQRRPGQS
jgi:monovalent cation:H+ antiporter-2, CPA2 family